MTIDLCLPDQRGYGNGPQGEISDQNDEGKSAKPQDISHSLAISKGQSPKWCGQPYGCWFEAADQGDHGRQDVHPRVRP